MQKFIALVNILNLSFCKIKCKKYGLQFEEMEKALLGTCIHVTNACEIAHPIIDWKA